MKAFFDRVDAADPLALGICVMTLLLVFGIPLVIQIGIEKRRRDREQKRRRDGYHHRLCPVIPPTPRRPVTRWPSIRFRDDWAPSAEEGHGHPGPGPGYHDPIAENAERHRRSLDRRPT